MNKLPQWKVRCLPEYARTKFERQFLELMIELTYVQLSDYACDLEDKMHDKINENGLHANMWYDFHKIYVGLIKDIEKDKISMVKRKSSAIVYELRRILK